LGVEWSGLDMCGAWGLIEGTGSKTTCVFQGLQSVLCAYACVCVVCVACGFCLVHAHPCGFCVSCGRGNKAAISRSKHVSDDSNNRAYER
jgi:hypothetical protein